MLRTLNPSTAKTAEIMARYRPIAPRPQVPVGSNGEGSGSATAPSSMSPTIRQSPYLRNVWPHLQSRPTRTRKRGRTSLGPPPPPNFKRTRSLLQGLSPARSFSFGPVTLPLLPPPSSPLHHHMQPANNAIDLNKVAEIPEEKDLLAQLQQKPVTNIISPRPVRLIPSTVTIRPVKDGPPVNTSPVMKTAEEVEKELESQVLPAFVSDSNNQVRLVNSAYGEMIGQPECPWLASMIAADACRSICGEVVLNFMADAMVSSGGFSCWTRIEWGVNGNNNSVNAFGEAMRLACESKDYKLAWRFHTKEAASNSDVQV